MLVITIHKMSNASRWYLVAKSHQYHQGSQREQLRTLVTFLGVDCVSSNQRPHVVWLTVASQCFHIARVAIIPTLFSFCSYVTMDVNPAVTVYATPHAFLVRAKAVASRGISGAWPPHLKSVPHHLTFGPPVAAYFQYCILKMWPPLLVFGPSWFWPPCCLILATGLLRAAKNLNSMLLRQEIWCLGNYWSLMVSQTSCSCWNGFGVVLKVIVTVFICGVFK